MARTSASYDPFARGHFHLGLGGRYHDRAARSLGLVHMGLMSWLFMRATDPDAVLLLFLAMAPAGIALHPVEQIINVSWGGGLAVEFFDNAG
jgi:hypothetical protein